MPTQEPNRRGLLQSENGYIFNSFLRTLSEGYKCFLPRFDFVHTTTMVRLRNPRLAPFSLDSGVILLNLLNDESASLGLFRRVIFFKPILVCSGRLRNISYLTRRRQSHRPGLAPQKIAQGLALMD
jgi:hypothetical protein